MVLMKTRQKLRQQVSVMQGKKAEKMIKKHDHKRNKKTVVYKEGDQVI